MNSAIQEIISNYLWFIIAIGFGIGETFTATFYLLPFALGGLVAGLVSLIGLSLQIQGIVFLVFSGVGIYLVAKYAKPRDEDNLSTTGSFRYVGDEFILDDSVNEYTPVNVNFKGDAWKAVSSSGEINKGTLVAVVKLDGTKLVVEKVK
jgi:membrane protein implicated in regulation of membrane protease activity